MLDPQQAQDLLIKKAATNFRVFFALMSEGTKKIEKHQDPWLAMLTDASSRFNVLVAPRGGGKTTFMEWFMAWYMGRHPERSNLIICVGQEQATVRFDSIRSIFDSELYQKIFPNIKIDTNKPDTHEKFTLWDTSKGSYKEWLAWAAVHKTAPRDPSLRGVPMLSSTVVGMRVSGILWLDDIMDEKNTATVNLINKSAKYIDRTVLPTMTKTAQLAHISTRWAPDDVVERHMAKSGWRSHVQAALTQDEFGNTISYWPEAYPVEALEQIRESDGDYTFEIMYQNNPLASTGDLFTREALEQLLPDPLPPMTRGVFMGIDPAFGTKTRNDNTAIALIGIDQKWNFYLLELRVGKFSKLRIINEVKAMYDLAEQWGGCKKIFVEKVAAQVYLINDLIEATRFPIEGVPVANQGDKTAKAQTFSLLATRKRYFAPWDTQVGRMHRAECLGLPSNQRDDTVDAVTLIINKVFGVKRASRPRVHTVKIPTKARARGHAI